MLLLCPGTSSRLVVGEVTIQGLSLVSVQPAHSQYDIQSKLVRKSERPEIPIQPVEDVNLAALVSGKLSFFPVSAELQKEELDQRVSHINLQARGGRTGVPQAPGNRRKHAIVAAATGRKYTMKSRANKTGKRRGI